MNGAPELAHDQEWQRLDPRMLLVYPLREVIRFLPVLIGIFVAGAASGGGLWQVVGVAVPVALGLLRYLTTSFRIAAGRVELRRGLLSRHVLSTPLDRVRTVDLTSSLIHRVLGLTTVRIGTGVATSEFSEKLDLDGLPAERARELRNELLHVVPRAETADGEPVEPAEREVLRFDLSWIRFAPLTSSGLVITAALIGGGSQVLNGLDVWEDFDPSEWSVAVPLWIGVVVALAGFGVAVAGLSVAGYLVTNWGFRLAHAAGSWHATRGLLTTRETSIDDERVAGVTIGEPWGLRLGGGGRLSAIVTGLDATQLGASTLVPPAPRAVVARVAGLVLGVVEPIVAPLTRHGPAATQRRYTRAVVPATVLLAAIVATVVLTSAPWWLLVPAVLAVVAAVALAADRAHSLGHGLERGYVVARSGSLVRRRDALAVDHVIGWNLRATWFQRRVGLTTLVATTAGGRQSVTVLDIPEGDAVDLAGRALPDLLDQFRR